MELDSVVKEKAKKQIEFYFSDSNAPFDSFLIAKIKAHPEGYVELATICAFKRMLHILSLPAGQTPGEIPNTIIQQVADALATSDSVEVSPERDHVRRLHALGVVKAAAAREMDARSIFSEPLPFDVSIDTLTEAFGKLAHVRSVRMRRHMTTRAFRGSVFVEFDSQQIAKEVVASGSLVFEGAKQNIQLKNDFLLRKRRKDEEAAKANLVKPEIASLQAPAAGSTPQTEMQGIESATPPADGAADGDPDALAKRKREGPGAEPPAVEAPTASKPRLEPEPGPHALQGVALKIKLPEEVVQAQPDYCDISRALGGRPAGVQFVEYEKESDTAWIRMGSPEQAAAVLGKAGEGGKAAVVIKHHSVEVELSALEGEEAIAFIEKGEAVRQRSLANRQNGGGPFIARSRGRFGRGRGRGRGRYPGRVG